MLTCRGACKGGVVALEGTVFRVVAKGHQKKANHSWADTLRFAPWSKGEEWNLNVEIEPPMMRTPIKGAMSVVHISLDYMWARLWMGAPSEDSQA